MIRVRIRNPETIRTKLRPQQGIKVDDSNKYLFDPDLILESVEDARDWAIKTDGLVDEEDYSSKAWAIGGTGTETNNSKYYAEQASTSATNSQTWAEGTDAQVALLGGEKSSKGWAARAEELVASIGTVLHYKGSVATYADLPTSGQEVGDVWNVLSDGSNYAWNGTEWDDLSGIVDLSAYRTSADQDIIDAGKQDTLVSGTNIKTINNNSILGSGNVDIDALPSQTGQSGKFLTTDGTDASWANVDALPSQTGQSGKYLTTDGSSASWATVSVNPDNKSITTNSSSQLQTVGVIDQNNTSNAIKTWTGTRAQYDAIVSKDPNTLYNITDDTDITVPILEALYPVGSVYRTYNATCPLSALINGSVWAQEVVRELVEKKEPTDNDPSWYNLYSDGWCEQGGIYNFSSSSYLQYSLIKEYRDLDYDIVATFYDLNAQNTSSYPVSIGTLSTTGFYAKSGVSSTTNHFFFWQACGYTSTTTTLKQFRRTA